MSKFKVGDKVKVLAAKGGTNVSGLFFSEEMEQYIGKSYKVEKIKNCGHYKLEKITWCFNDSMLALSEEEPNEFTFEEVIARIKEGEVYENINDMYTTKSIRKIDGQIRVYHNAYKGGYLSVGMFKYKLINNKEEYTLYEVEHQQNGKRYLFRGAFNDLIGAFVVCDTKKGKSYGLVVKAVTKELTQEEYDKYAPITEVLYRTIAF